jgi:hypothetical protein
MLRERLRMTIFMGVIHMANSCNGFQCGLPPRVTMRLLALMPLTVFVSCQAYDFERVVPVFVSQRTTKEIVARKRLKPNVMLLVDNSGSMLEPTDRTDPDCLVRNGQNVSVLCGSASEACPLACPTRVSEMKSAMQSFLQASATVSRLGLTVFPNRGTADNGLVGCDPSTGVVVNFPDMPNDDGQEPTLSSTAMNINTELQRLSPLGGTPTAASLDFLSTYSGLTQSSAERDDYRSDFVLLLTDGLPNCNGANANAVCAGPSAACECTTMSCAGSDARSSTCAKGCLDRDVTVQKVKALNAKGIRTIVVGFGADLATGNGPLVLNAMAREGGFPRRCPGGTNAECGGTNTCDVSTQLCSTAFYQAANGDELAQALAKISKGIVLNPCEFVLPSKPSDKSYLSVLVDGQVLTAGTATYAYDFDGDRVTFLGEACRKIEESLPQSPVRVEFRVVERF